MSHSILPPEDTIAHGWEDEPGKTPVPKPQPITTSKDSFSQNDAKDDTVFPPIFAPRSQKAAREEPPPTPTRVQSILNRLRAKKEADAQVSAVSRTASTVPTETPAPARAAKSPAPTQAPQPPPPPPATPDDVTGVFALGVLVPQLRETPLPAPQVSTEPKEATKPAPVAPIVLDTSPVSPPRSRRRPRFSTLFACCFAMGISPASVNQASEAMTAQDVKPAAVVVPSPVPPAALEEPTQDSGKRRAIPVMSEPWERVDGKFCSRYHAFNTDTARGWEYYNVCSEEMYADTDPDGTRFFVANGVRIEDEDVLSIGEREDAVLPGGATGSCSRRSIKIKVEGQRELFVIAPACQPNEWSDVW